MKSFVLLTTIGLSLLLYQVTFLVNVSPQLSLQTRIAELETILLNEVSMKNMFKERLQEVLETKKKNAVMTAQSDGVETEDRGKEQQHSKMPATELPHGRIDARDAIVVTASYIDDCLASRLRHLVESSQRSSIVGVQRDVWVLHNHYKFDERYANNETFAQQFTKPYSLFNDTEFPIISNDAKVARSRELIASIPGLHSASQSILTSSTFDTEQSGPSKSSFLKLLAQHKYRFGWHLEGDVFYTGQWGVLFDDLDPDSTHAKTNSSRYSINAADVLPILHFQQKNERWWSYSKFRQCSIDTGQGNWPDSIKHCSDIAPFQTAWFTIRVTGTFASSLLRDLGSAAARTTLRSAIGHHEAIVGAYSKIRNFTVQPIPMDHIGEVYFGGTKRLAGPDADRKCQLEYYSPEKNKLYHPVKCSSYPPGGLEQELKKWTSIETVG